MDSKDARYEALVKAVGKSTKRGTFGKGVVEYALEIADEVHERDIQEGKDSFTLDSEGFENECLNCASDWMEYSYGGCALVSNHGIALRLASPSELRRTKEGGREPSGTKTWLDLQGSALVKAFGLLDEKRKEVYSV